MKALGNLQSTPGSAALDIPERPGFPPEARRLVEELRSVCESQGKLYVLSPTDAALLLIPDALLEDRECLWVLCLNTRNRIIDKSCVYQGTLNQTHVRVGEIFRKAILLNAASIVIAHNHPSGDTSPSPEDVALTRSLVQAGKLLDIEVLDHLILGGADFISLKTKGLGF